jgi:hypothetical protein
MKRVSLQWRLTAGVLALAALVLGVRATAYGDGDKQDPKKDAPKKETPKKKPRAERLKDLEDLLDRMQGLDDKSLKDLRDQMDAARKELEKAMQLMQKQGMPAFPAMPAMPMMPGGVFGRMGRLDRQGTMQETRLGAQLRKPSTTLADQLDLPKGQGQVLEEVGPNSPAAKAGLKQHDILLELAGKPVPSGTTEFSELLKGVKPNSPVNAVVLRKGKKETIKGLSLPEAKAAAPALPAFPAFPAFPALPGRMIQGIGGIGGLNGSTTISRVNDEFTANHNSDGVKISVKGKIDQGKPQVSEVKIESNGQSKTYSSVDKVPAEYKEKVEKLVQMSARGGAINIRIR